MLTVDKGLGKICFIEKTPMVETLKIYCQGVQLDISDDTSLRLNKQLFDPARMNSRDTEYSFSVDFPATPVNNKAFGFANHLNASAKFSKRYPCKVYSGEIEVFDGSLLLQSFSAPDQTYSANLVAIKVLTVDDIFGDSTLYDLEWYEEYSGSPTINEVNSGDTDYYFPLVAYGVFEKKPYFSDEVANDYTDRLLLDNTTLFYHETFVPSLNYLSLVERCFAQKGYRLTGDIYEDKWLKNLFLSVSLPSEQIPTYNLANPKIGSVDISVNWENAWTNGNARVFVGGITQDLDYPYALLRPGRGYGGMQMGNTSGPIFHWTEIEHYNLFDNSNHHNTVTENISSYMFDVGEQCVVIPADGAYRIDLEVEAVLDTTFNNGEIKGEQEYYTSQSSETYLVTRPQNITETCPIEIQLVRNVLNGDANIELIKGKHNIIYTQSGSSSATTADTITCYPHECLYNTDICPTEYDSTPYKSTPFKTPLGYIPHDNEIMAYDPYVSNNFICGFSSYGVETVSVIKNGKSWYKGESEYTNSFYDNSGYIYMDRNDGWTNTEYGKNDYPDAPTSNVEVYTSGTSRVMSGHVYCTVWLQRNDMLTLNAVLRSWTQDSNAHAGDISNKYKVSVNARLKMNALTPRDYAYAREQNLGYLSDSQFDQNLRLSNFLSSGETMANFVNNFIKSFNLDYTQTGKVVTLNKGKINSSQQRYFVDIDKNAAWSDGEWSKIDFPRTMGVKYSIDKDEWGAWTTVPYEHRNDYNWKDYVDGGYDIIELDPDATSSNEITNSLSYCWYQPFTLVEYESDGETESGYTALNLPVIGKYASLAEGKPYEDAMKDDALSNKMRCWFRGNTSGKSVKIQNEDEYVELYIPEGYYDDLENSYHSGSDTLLTRYFNLVNDATLDKLEIDVVLTPLEYQMIANGADVKFDNNLYQVSEISGYDPTGEEAATLTLVQKQLI